jgi:uracil-DNA glycosylase
MIACLRAAQALDWTGSNQMASKSELQLGQLQAIDSLRWWIRVGVTNALDEMPHDRFADVLAGDGGERGAPNASESTQQSLRSLSETESRAIQDAPSKKKPETAEISARALAQAATDLETLRSVMAEFDGCTLKRTATQLVFADGRPGSRIMLIGEAPGEGEDRIGRPFVGRAGQLLDRMLSAIGLDRQNVYIANVVPWRPPGNRTPTLQETQICLPFIERQIELADPEFLVCLGGSAARIILGVRSGIMRARGVWLPYPGQTGRDIQALAMLHPAFLLRQPAHKRFAWADMRTLARTLEGPSR